MRNVYSVTIIFLFLVVTLLSFGAKSVEASRFEAVRTCSGIRFEQSHMGRGLLSTGTIDGGVTFTSNGFDPEPYISIILTDTGQTSLNVITTYSHSNSGKSWVEDVDVDVDGFCSTSPTPTPTPPGPTITPGGPTLTPINTPTPTPAGGFCGDNVCQAFIGEGCASCEYDCGTCFPPTYARCSTNSCFGRLGFGTSSCGPVDEVSTADFGAWSACPSCGNGSQTRTCACNGSCAPTTCSDVDGTAACGAGQTRVCACASTAPVSPTGITVVEGDANGGSILQTRRAKIDWTFPGSASGCGTEWGFSCAGNTNAFSLQITGGGVNQIFNLPSTARTYSTGPILTANATYTITICADNGALQTCASITKDKVPYPTGAITGAFMEQDADTNACLVGIRGLPVMNMTTSQPLGATTVCSATGGPVAGSYTGYVCTIVLDNVNNDPDPVGHQLSIAMTPSSSVYTGGASCGPASAGGTCAGGIGSCANLLTANFDANAGATNTETTSTAYFSLNNLYSFFKLKNASFYRSSGITSLFPFNHRSFDADDTPLLGHFNRGNTAANARAVGAVVTNGTQAVGAIGTSNNGVSAPGWRNEAYTAVSRRTGVSQFIEYIKARKDYTVITSLSDAAFTSRTNGTFVVEGNLTINAGNAGTLAGKQVIIVATGVMSIASNVTPANSTIALVSPVININETVGEVQALVAGNTVTLVSTGFGGNSTTPLKIVGNLFSGDTVDTTTRIRADSFSPSLFVVQDPSMYDDLLSGISVVKYDWKQLQ